MEKQPFPMEFIDLHKILEITNLLKVAFLAKRIISAKFFAIFKLELLAV
jgi:hypothetical protein